MKIRFLQTCPSDSEYAPFHPGQVIDVEQIPSCVLALQEGRDYVLVDDTERAVETNLERAEPVRVKGPNRRVKP